MTPRAFKLYVVALAIFMIAAVARIERAHRPLLAAARAERGGPSGPGRASR